MLSGDYPVRGVLPNFYLMPLPLTNAEQSEPSGNMKLRSV